MGVGRCVYGRGKDGEGQVRGTEKRGNATRQVIEQVHQRGRCQVLRPRIGASPQEVQSLQYSSIRKAKRSCNWRVYVFYLDSITYLRHHFQGSTQRVTVVWSMLLEGTLTTEIKGIRY